jgi:hypothetical protein
MIGGHAMSVVCHAGQSNRLTRARFPVYRKAQRILCDGPGLRDGEGLSGRDSEFSRVQLGTVFMARLALNAQVNLVDGLLDEVDRVDPMVVLVRDRHLQLVE